MAKTHFGFLHSVAFALPRDVKAGKPWHTMLPLQTALCVCRSHATQFSERHLQSEQMWRISFAVNLLSCNYNGRQHSYSSLRNFKTGILKIYCTYYSISRPASPTMERHWIVSDIKINVFNINLCSLSLIMLFSFFDNSKKNIIQLYWSIFSKNHLVCLNYIYIYFFIFELHSFQFLSNITILLFYYYC